MGGIVAAGHPVSAEAGARVLREGGNAVDAALAAVIASLVAEPLLTGLGAGGYLLVAGAGREPELIDFFVATPSGEGSRALREIEISFGGDATQAFHLGAASCGVWGVPAGLACASERHGTVALSELCAAGARLAREGVVINAQQEAFLAVLEPILRSTPEASALYAPHGRLPRIGDAHRDPALADALERLGAQGAAPFYTGELGDAVRAWLDPRGGAITRADLASYAPVVRAPARTRLAGRDVLTNPPPSAGGLLIAYALERIERGESVVAAMEAAQAARTPAFLDGLGQPGFAEAFRASHLGSTTHISALDDAGLACGVTCTNGEGSGEVVPGTGMHVNNMLGEADLSPLGFFRHPAGRRLPSMMAPTIVMGEDGAPELVLGSAGSNRIRSAIVGVILGAVRDGLDVQAAVDAPRSHVEDGVVSHEPGAELTGCGDRERVAFRDRNLFFGGVQAVRRDPRTGVLSGAGDPRRGGAAVRA